MLLVIENARSNFPKSIHKDSNQPLKHEAKYSSEFGNQFLVAINNQTSSTIYFHVINCHYHYSFEILEGLLSL
jgi:hypothetical protein